MFIIFASLLFLGLPVAFAMAISGTITILSIGEISGVLIPQRFFMALNSFPLMAVPFFILAGELMNSCGIIRRIVKFSSVLLGALPGSLAQVNVLASIIMAGFSGSATADAVAIGGMLIPAMIQDGYPPGFTAGITASSACIGPIIPPSCVMVIYGAITGLSVGTLFIAGIIPGLMIGISLMLMVAFFAKKNKWSRGEKFTISKLINAFKQTFFALLAPFIILGGIITGITTATEAGVVTSVYALAIGMFIYKEIQVKDLLKILTRAAINTAIPLIIISGASIFGWVLAYNNFAGILSNFLFSISDNVYIISSLIIGMLLIIGLFVEGGAATIIFVPILFPLGYELGFDPIHFAMMIMITILIGTITPPVGLQLYIAAGIAKIPIEKVMIWPFVFAMLSVVLLLTFVPSLVTFLPSVFFGN